MDKDIKIKVNDNWYDAEINFFDKILIIKKNSVYDIIPYGRINSITREKEDTLLIYLNNLNEEIKFYMKLQNRTHEKLVIDYQKDMPVIEPNIKSNYKSELDKIKDEVIKDEKKLSSTSLAIFLFLVSTIALYFVSLINNLYLYVLFTSIALICVIIIIINFVRK